MPYGGPAVSLTGGRALPRSHTQQRLFGICQETPLLHPQRAQVLREAPGDEVRELLGRHRLLALYLFQFPNDCPHPKVICDRPTVS